MKKDYQIVVNVDAGLYDRWVKHQELVRGYKKSRYGKVSIMKINSKTFSDAIKNEMNKPKK